MTSIDQLFQWYTIAAAVALLGGLWLGMRRVGFARLLTRREALVGGKLLFIVMAAMLMVLESNSIKIPAGQFIYGRF